MNGRSWIGRRLGASSLEQLATGLSGSELQSVLLEVMHHRAAARGPKDVLAQYQRDTFCAPASVDLRASMHVDSLLLAAASGFEALELSPVAPLGTCSAVAVTDQNRVLSAMRMTELVSDPTNVLALECALRLRRKPDAQIHLATSQRVLRTPPIPRRPGYTQHFRLFVLTSGGAEQKDHAFTIETVLSHIRTLLDGLDRLEQSGFSFGSRSVRVFSTAERRAIAERVVTALGGLARLEALEHPYYSGGLRYQIWATMPDGAELLLVDGGSFDWLAQMTSNRRAVCVASGIGTQLIALCFAVATAR